MKFAISIGSHELLSYVELNILQCRRVFGPDVPILISDSKSANSGMMRDLAARLDCYYVGESANRGHFMGCAQNAVNALAFASNQGADIAVKLNQRLILISPKIREMVEMIFSNPEIALALPGRPNPDLILTTKWFARFPFLNDIFFVRVGAITPEEFKLGYEKQCREKKTHQDFFTETFMANLIRDRFPKSHAVIEALTNHVLGMPHLYLRKVQNGRKDFVNAAMAMGMTTFDYPVQEWQQLSQGKYRPFPVIA